MNQRFLTRRQLSSNKIASGFRLVTHQVFNRPLGGFVKRVGIIISAYMVINSLFNAMLFVMTLDYVKQFQHIPKSFKLIDQYRFLQGVISSDILLKPKDANVEYELILKEILALKDSDFLLNDDQLARESLEFITGYLDLVLRYAFSCKDEQLSIKCIERLLHISQLYQGCNPHLLNQAYRSLLSIPENSEMAEDLYIKLINISAKNDDIKFATFGIIPPNVKISEELLQSEIELVYFYIDHKRKIDDSLAILLSLLRSFEYEKLEKLQLFIQTHQISAQRDLTKIESEIIPMLKSNISEILWFDKNYHSAIQWCKESVMESISQSRQNYNSARICKNSLKNLSQMYSKLHQEEKAELYLQKSNDINLLIPSNRPARLRDVLLDNYLGYWGKVIFP